MLRKMFVLFSGMCLLAAVHAADPQGAVLVNLAGEERMLSQRVVKAYAQIGLGVMPDLAVTQMRESIARFDANLERLRAVAGGDGVAAALDRLAADWGELRAAAVSVSTRDSALRLSMRSLAVLDAAERLTEAVENAFPGSANRLVNLAGRQRMLSQRVAKAYMLHSWGAESGQIRDEMEAATRKFSDLLAALLAEPGNTPEIRAELDEMALQWEWLQTALSAEGAVSYRLVVAEAADSILESSDRITQLYQRLEHTPARAGLPEDRP